MAIHTLQVVLAGTWLGSLVFTRFVVSPGLGKMRWAEAERVQVRSIIGGQFSRLATPLLILLLALLVAAPLTGRIRWEGRFWAELALLLLVMSLTGVHGAYFGLRLNRLAAAEVADEPAAGSGLAHRRHRLQRISEALSMTNLALSLALLVLVANG